MPTTPEISPLRHRRPSDLPLPSRAFPSPGRFVIGRSRISRLLSWGLRQLHPHGRRRVSAPPSTTRRDLAISPEPLDRIEGRARTLPASHRADERPAVACRPPRSCSAFGDGLPGPPSRSDLAVSLGLAGFLRARVASIAARCRPWGSPRFAPAVRPPAPHLDDLAIAQASCARLGGGLPAAPYHPSKDLSAPQRPAAVSRFGLPPCASGSPAAPTRPPTVASRRVRRSRVGPVRSEGFLRSPVGVPDPTVADRAVARPPWALLSLRGPATTVETVGPTPLDIDRRSRPPPFADRPDTPKDARMGRSR